MGSGTGAVTVKASSHVRAGAPAIFSARGCIGSSSPGTAQRPGPRLSSGGGGGGGGGGGAQTCTPSTPRPAPPEAARR